MVYIKSIVNNFENKVEFSFTASGSVIWQKHFGKLAASTKAEHICITHDPAMLVLDICSAEMHAYVLQKNMYKNVHINFALE